MKSLVAGMEELGKLAGEFATRLIPKQNGATIVTLSGDLGAGKTAFAKALAREFGIDEDVTSPTYVIEKIYAPAKGAFSRFIHIDAYRLNSAHDLDVLGWRELLADSGNLIILEWPERVEDAIPKSAVNIAFEIEGERRILTVHEKGK
ncbi:MAG: tRNA (adenosine(37)-N6)-threonylcarbamoyltransferase complex ATPase subunit type 1 TsaE [bacterium]|nr:tRNA (adenosine(37)-N6)-threonylcarbamoyltransferase complex ATPase subunit type 1 TsaE [bacterium]